MCKVHHTQRQAEFNLLYQTPLENNGMFNYQPQLMSLRINRYAPISKFQVANRNHHDRCLHREDLMLRMVNHLFLLNGGLGPRHA